MANHKRTPILERINQRSRWDGECFVWTGKTIDGGYGQVSVGGKRGRPVLVHRAAYAALHGEIPDGLCVCHTCDNPPCHRDEHLFLGTRGENNADRSRKGRSKGWPVGEAHPYSRLTAENVRQVRSLAFAGQMTQRQIAFRFGVSESAINHIVGGRTWRAA